MMKKRHHHHRAPSPFIKLKNINQNNIKIGGGNEIEEEKSQTNR
jgi:hypothetical protein